MGSDQTAHEKMQVYFGQQFTGGTHRRTDRRRPVRLSFLHELAKCPCQMQHPHRRLGSQSCPNTTATGGEFGAQQRSSRFALELPLRSRLEKTASKCGGVAILQCKLRRPNSILGLKRAQVQTFRPRGAPSSSSLGHSQCRSGKKPIRMRIRYAPAARTTLMLIDIESLSPSSLRSWITHRRKTETPVYPAYPLCPSWTPPLARPPTRPPLFRKKLNPPICP